MLKKTATMLTVRKQDPLFINFQPKTAEEAVDRYVRCKRRGLKPYLIPECLISCAQGLKPEELEKFEQWIVNPAGDITTSELVETKEMQADNAAIFTASAMRVEGKLRELPPLPSPSMSELSLVDDEKRPPSENEEELMPDAARSDELLAAGAAWWSPARPAEVEDGPVPSDR